MTTELRVLVVTIVHDPEDARIRYRQIPALVEAGHHVVYAAPFDAFGRTPPDGVEGLSLPVASGRHRLRAIRAARSLLRRIGAHADVILFHDPDLLLAAAGLHRRLAPIVWDVHEDTAAALSMRAWVPTGFRRLLAACIRFAERWAERSCSLLLAEHSYRERFRLPHPVVPNSVRVPAEVTIAPRADRVVYLGKLSRPRGGAELIALARAMPELSFQLIGPAEPDLQPALEAATAAGTLEWMRFMPNEQALARLPGALAGLALLHDEPNYQHSLPTKLVEYMAHGVPVITTPNQASADLVASAEGGVVIPFGDIDAAARVLRSFVDDPEARIAYARHGYDYVAGHVNWHIDGPQFVRAVEEASRR